MSTTIIVNEDLPTPEELTEDMRRIAEYHDQELRHIIMDGALTDVLEKLGYTEAVEIFQNTSKWYA